MDDADLVGRARAGERDAWAAIYDRYADRLHDHCWAILRDEHEAADALHDAFIKAAGALDQLRDPTRLRPWLYAIARNEAFRRHRRRSRAVPTDFDEASPAMTAVTDDDEGAGAAAHDLQQLVWDAAGGLSPDDKSLLDLHLRQGLDGQDLAEALGITANNAYVKLHRLRETLERSLGALLVARTGSEDCEELQRLTAGWDGSLSPLLRKRVARHIDACEICGERKKRMVSPLALLAGVPLVPAPALLRQRTIDDATLVASTRAAGGSTGGPGGSKRRRRAGWMSGAAAAVLVVVALLAALLAGGGDGDGLLAAGDVGSTTTETTVASGSSSTVGDDDPGTAGDVAVEGAELGNGGEPGEGGANDPETGPGETTPETEPPGVAPPPPGSSPGTTPTTTSPPAPGNLALSTGQLDFGDATTTRTLAVTNTGGRPVSMSATDSSPALTVSPSAASIAPGDTVTLTVALDRSSLPEGPIAESVTITGHDGTSAVADDDVPVAGTVRRPPSVGSLTIQPSVFQTTCNRSNSTATVTVPVSDDSGIASVILHWSGPGGAGSKQIRSSGNGVLGPFTEWGTAEAWVVVTDVHGNSATSPRAGFEVQPCPG